MESREKIDRGTIARQRHVIDSQAQIIRNMRDKVTQMDAAWQAYTAEDGSGVSEDKWALEKMLALLLRRESRWW